MQKINKLTSYDLAFSRLLCYICLQYPSYAISAHHRIIADALEKVERGEILRLIIEVPPRHGKSMQVSRYFPPWYLGRNPDRQIICSSYAQDLADDFGREVRNQIKDPMFQQIFPGVSLRDDSSSISRFHTTKGGVYNAMGVGGAATGKGANLFIIDDPIKNREEADSETIRKKIQGWYTSTAYTRLMPGGAIIIMMTRWHEADLIGWVLTEHSHENWHRIRLPAIAEENDTLGRKPGEALWPFFYNEESLTRIRRTIGTRDWNALYQQRPAPEEGDFFKHQWFKWYDILPEHLHFYGASDYAVTADGGDYTVHIVFGVDKNDHIYVIDIWRRQASSIEWVEALLDLMERYKPLAWAEESGQIIKSLDPIIKKRQLERKVFCLRQQYASAADKATRAQSIRARAEMGMLHLPKSAPWVPDLIHELMTFPAGKNDDQVDVLSLFSRMLASLRKAKEPEKLEEFKVNTKMPTFEQAFQDHLRQARALRDGTSLLK